MIRVCLCAKVCSVSAFQSPPNPRRSLQVTSTITSHTLRVEFDDFDAFDEFEFDFFTKTT